MEKSIGEIGGLFKKKKKDSVMMGYDSRTEIQPAGKGLAHAGELAPSAKSIDADQLYSFNAGE